MITEGWEPPLPNIHFTDIIHHFHGQWKALRDLKKTPSTIWHPVAFKKISLTIVNTCQKQATTPPNKWKCKQRDIKTLPNGRSTAKTITNVSNSSESNTTAFINCPCHTHLKNHTKKSRHNKNCDYNPVNTVVHLWTGPTIIQYRNETIVSRREKTLVSQHLIMQISIIQMTSITINATKSSNKFLKRKKEQY